METPRRLEQVRILATGDYIVAAEVAVFSFLRTNPWFGGRIRVYTTGKEHETVANRFRHIENVEATTIDDDFVDLITKSLALTDRPANWIPERYLALALFVDTCDGNVLIIDADVMFTGSVESLTTTPGTFVAASDAASYLGCLVDRTTNELIAADQATPGQCLDAAFNSGMMRVSPEHLGPEMLTLAVEWLRPDVLDYLKLRQHDQFILNRVFDGEWTLCGAEFNYLVGFPHQIFEQTGVRLSDAFIVHFNCDPRPWAVQALDSISDPLVARATALWQRSLAAMIEDRALRQAVSGP